MSPCKGLAQYIALCDVAGDVLSDEEIEIAQTGGQAFLGAYSALASDAAHASSFTWKLRPKSHQVDHQFDFLSSGLNPRVWECWFPEDLMRRLGLKLMLVPLKSCGETCLLRSILQIALKCVSDGASPEVVTWS